MDFSGCNTDNNNTNTDNNTQTNTDSRNLTKWKLLINGLTLYSAFFWADSFNPSASTSWAKITSSDSTSATIKATLPANLNVDSAVSVTVAPLSAQLHL